MIVPQVKLVNNPSVDDRLLSEGGLIVSGFKPVESVSAATEDKSSRQQVLSLKVPASSDDLGEQNRRCNCKGGHCR